VSEAALDRPGIRCINRTTSSLRKDPLNSGNTELDTYLKRNAKQNDRLRTARTLVALFCEDNYTIAGYYAGRANLLTESSQGTSPRIHSRIDKKAPNPHHEPSDLSAGLLSSILKSKI
jgi:hypothetical protein